MHSLLHCQVTGTRHLVSPTRIDTNAPCASQIEGEGGFPDLRLLELGSNRLRRIAGLDHMTSLRELWLGRNRIAAIEGLSQCGLPSCSMSAPAALPVPERDCLLTLHTVQPRLWCLGTPSLSAARIESFQRGFRRWSRTTMLRRAATLRASVAESQQGLPDDEVARPVVVQRQPVPRALGEAFGLVTVPL